MAEKGDCSIGVLLLYLLGMVGIIVLSVLGQGASGAMWFFGFLYCFLSMGVVWTFGFLLYLSVGWERNNEKHD